MLMLLMLSVLENEDDIKLFCDIYKARRQAVYLFAYRTLRDKYLAEDAESEAFIKLLSIFDKVKRLSGVKREKYITSSLKNAVIDFYRAHQSNCKHEILTDEFEDASTKWDNTFEGVIKTIDREAVISALNSLDTEQRNLITRRYVENASVAELARELNLPRSTLQSRLNSAKKIFAEKYLQIAGDSDE
ncbi:MAG: sigma-70 family RNA polymerase sigma factor [Clostridia bacterium]|nr:sigma-70 family RNA polymerase sigma factor [Clostridia bacterium]